MKQTTLHLRTKINIFFQITIIINAFFDKCCHFAMISLQAGPKFTETVGISQKDIIMVQASEKKLCEICALCVRRSACSSIPRKIFFKICVSQLACMQLNATYMENKH